MSQARSGGVYAPGEAPGDPSIPTPLAPLPSEALEQDQEGGADVDPAVAEFLRLKNEVGSSSQERPQERRMIEAKPDRPDMDIGAANALLEMMLSTEPPALDKDVYRIGRLTRTLREDGRLPTPGPKDDEEAPQFNFRVWLRGLEDTELEIINERCMREPTRDEREQGITMKVQDSRAFQRLVVTEAMIAPDPHTPSVTGKYGRPEDFVRAWFAPGEIQQLYAAVNDLSGWGSGAVERAKKF